jgi:hypothetical protein
MKEKPTKKENHNEEKPPRRENMECPTTPSRRNPPRKSREKQPATIYVSPVSDRSAHKKSTSQKRARTGEAKATTKKSRVVSRSRVFSVSDNMSEDPKAVRDDSMDESDKDSGSESTISDDVRVPNIHENYEDDDDDAIVWSRIKALGEEEMAQRKGKRERENKQKAMARRKERFEYQVAALCKNIPDNKLHPPKKQPRKRKEGDKEKQDLVGSEQEWRVEFKKYPKTFPMKELDDELFEILEKVRSKRQGALLSNKGTDKAESARRDREFMAGYDKLQEAFDWLWQMNLKQDNRFNPKDPSAPFLSLTDNKKTAKNKKTANRNTNEAQANAAEEEAQAKDADTTPNPDTVYADYPLDYEDVPSEVHRAAPGVSYLQCFLLEIKDPKVQYAMVSGYGTLSHTTAMSKDKKSIQVNGFDDLCQTEYRFAYKTLYQSKKKHISEEKATEAADRAAAASVRLFKYVKELHYVIDDFATGTTQSPLAPLEASVKKWDELVQQFGRGLSGKQKKDISKLAADDFNKGFRPASEYPEEDDYFYSSNPLASVSWWDREPRTSYMMDKDPSNTNTKTPFPPTSIGMDAIEGLQNVVMNACEQVYKLPEGRMTDMQCQFDHGLLRQGCRNIHQVMHLDNYSVSTDSNGIWLKYAKEGITKLNMDELIKQGVVVDMPLSPKGSYVRIAVPDPASKTFVINWVFVPFGFVLVRSMLLMHGGHYGDPGDTRFHATLIPNTTPRDVTKLLYIYEAVGTDPELRKWKMQWSKETPYDARDDNAIRAGRAKNDIIKTLKQIGTRNFTTNFEDSPMCNRVAARLKILSPNAMFRDKNTSKRQKKSEDD